MASQRRSFVLSWLHSAACVSLACFVVLGILATSGCRTKSEQGEILIGHFASMTGPEATFGQSTDKAIRIAIDEINEKGGVNGRKVKLITYDDKGETREAGSAVTRLVTNDGVVAVLGEFAS